MSASLAPAVVIVAALTLGLAPAPQARQLDERRWLAIVERGYAVPEGRAAIDVLIEMNALLASPNPRLRDDVAFGAAKRWIRAGALTPAEMRQLMALWLANTADGLGTVDDRVYWRSFSALCLSLIAARDLTHPFLETTEVQWFFDRMLAYLAEEHDLRGFDPVHGWTHAVAHVSDTLKFLARNPKLASGSDGRLLRAVGAKIETAPTVFVWGENDRMAQALQAAVRRPDADPAALAAWTDDGIAAYTRLWSGGPHVDARLFARVENTRQVMRSLHTALAAEANPTSTGDSARQRLLTALVRMR